LLSKHGQETGKFGLWLRMYLNEPPHNREFTVFYDHGDKQHDPNVAVIKGFYGRQVANNNRLADIDVMVVNKNNEAILLIEIEESSMPPKKLLGDAFSILMCNKFAVRIDNEQKYYTTCPESKLIIAGVVPARGDGQKKIEEVIKPRMKQFSVPSDTIQIENISIVFGNDISKTLDTLMSKVSDIFSKEVN
jgi:hypothetical protein